MILLKSSQRKSNWKENIDQDNVESSNAEDCIVDQGAHPVGVNSLVESIELSAELPFL